MATFYSGLGLDIAYDYDIQPGETARIVRAMVEGVKLDMWEKVGTPSNHCAVALSRNKRIHHVGIWISGGVLHAADGVGVVYNSIRQLERSGFHKVEFYKCKNIITPK